MAFYLLRANLAANIWIGDHFLIKLLPVVRFQKVYPLESVEFDEESNGTLFGTS